MNGALQTQAQALTKPSFTPVNAGLLQRKCACGGSSGLTSECKNCDNKKLSLQRSTEVAGSAMSNSKTENRNSSGVLPIVNEVLHSPGQPLEAETRAFFEPRFGHDFSRVRVHSDSRAAESAKAVAAQAYTVGRNIAFATGRYAPETIAGKRLLAHELTHVVQQGEQSGLQEKLEVSQPNGPAERQADHVAEQVMRGDTVSAAMLNSVPLKLQRNPGVGFTVHDMGLAEGQLGDPEEDGAGTISWPLNFDVAPPVQAKPDVEVTGAAGDPCADHSIGFLQTVHINWLHFYYWGKAAGDGSITVKHNVPLPIRDGDPQAMWYTADGVATPAACNVHVKPHMDDYPTLLGLSKVRQNNVTGQPNYLTGITRGMHFVTTLVDSSPAGINPLRFFYWNYLMDIEFTPNHAAPNAVWPFNWKTNKAHLDAVHSGADSKVPIFANMSIPYNQALVPQVNEKR